MDPYEYEAKGLRDVLASTEATAELGAGELHHLVALATHKGLGLGLRVSGLRGLGQV